MGKYLFLYPAFSEDRIELLDEDERQQLQRWVKQREELQGPHDKTFEALTRKGKRVHRVSLVIAGILLALAVLFSYRDGPYLQAGVVLLLSSSVWIVITPMGLGSGLIYLVLRYTSTVGKEYGRVNAQIRDVQRSAKAWIKSLNLDQRPKPAPNKAARDEGSTGRHYWATGGVYDPEAYHGFMSGRSTDQARTLIDRYGDVETYESNS